MPDEAAAGFGAARRRGIGIVVPFDFAIDHDLWAYLGEAATLHLTRTAAIQDPVISAELASQVSDLGEVADASTRVTPVTDTVIYACTSGSFVGGSAGEARIVQTLLDSGATRAATTSGALRESLDWLGVRRVGVVSPYEAALTEKLVTFLGEGAVDVTQAVSMGLRGEVHKVSAHELFELAVIADTPDAEALFISCTNLETFGLIEALEEHLGKPVLTANQVTMWKALRLVGAGESAPARRQHLFGPSAEQ